MTKRDTILIVDDVEINRAILRNVFEKEYNILEAENGEQALVFLGQYHGKIATVLLDLVMPVMDGYQVMEEVDKRGFLQEFPVIIITAEDSAQNEVKIFDMGASEIILKPFEPFVVRRRVQNIIELNLRKLNQQELIEEQAAKLRESNAVMIDALSSIIEYRSVETGQHIQRIRMFTKLLLENVAQCYPEFGLDKRKIEIIVSASSMHDIGKIAIPDSILNKPGRLTRDEFEIMKTHAVKGCEMLAGLDRVSDKEYLQYAYNICRYHHERWDGRGYPDGLKGNNIPVCAQVVGVADCYDALTTNRVYKKAIPPQQAFNMILNGECGVFSPKLLECLKNVREKFALLSKEYADGNMHKGEGVGPKQQPAIPEIPEMDTLQMGQMKYFAMLRYAEDTVMELDLTTGLYHLVYLADDSFAPLKNGYSFEDAVRTFACESVHPEDRQTAMRITDKYIQDFFDNGLMKKSERYRVYDKNLGVYFWCRNTLLRADTDNPRRRKVLLIWKRESGEELTSSQVERQFYNDVILRSVLICIQKFRYNQWFTLPEVSDGLSELLGYTKAEIREKFDNRFIDLIYMPDREDLRRQIESQLKLGTSLELEYRVVTKDGRRVWILGKGRIITGEDGLEYLYGALLDITKSKQEQEQLRLTLERHKIIMDQTNDIIFEWDILKNQLSYSSNWREKFGYEPIKNDVKKRLRKTSHVHPKDVPELVGFMSELEKGVHYKETELRIADGNGRYRWCRIRATAQFDGTGRPFKAVGVLSDIDKEKRASQELKNKAERDELTGLYNKRTARDKIERYLKRRGERDRSAMFILDVDDFKNINDNYGHMFGDAVLQEISSVLGELFSSRDIISRIGGDEFLIFMRDIKGDREAVLMAERIVKAFSTMFSENVLPFYPSCSVGIVFCPQDGEKFEVLFNNSDIALYDAKSRGKNCFTVYGKSALTNTYGARTRMLNISTRIDSNDQTNGLDTVLIERVLKIIYDSDSMDDAISDILELTGKEFGVSRAYVFEDSCDGAYCDNTYEWCNEGISVQKEILQHVKYKDLGVAYKSLFNEDSIFYCPDVNLLVKEQREFFMKQGVKSMLQCAIRDMGVFKGFVGFDDCVVRRLWTQEQISALTFISKLLSVYLLKKRAQDRAESTAADLENILDGQDLWIYAIDSDTYSLEYINAKTHAIVPEAREGMKCYKAYFKRDEPCERCPARRLKANEKEPIEIYNPILKIWTLTGASYINWKNKKNILLTCQDITDYKQN